MAQNSFIQHPTSGIKGHLIKPSSIIAKLKQDAEAEYYQCHPSLQENCALDAFILQECSVEIHFISGFLSNEDEETLVEYAKEHNAYSKDILIDGGFFYDPDAENYLDFPDPEDNCQNFGDEF